MTAKELHDKIMSSSYEDGLKAIQQYAAEVSQDRVNSAWLRGFNEGRLAHPIKEQEEQQ